MTQPDPCANPDVFALRFMNVVRTSVDAGLTSLVPRRV